MNRQAQILIAVVLAIITCGCRPSLSSSSHNSPATQDAQASSSVAPDARQPLRIDEQLQGQPIGRVLDVLEDRSGTWTINDVRTGEAGRFQPSTADYPQFGFTRSSYWFRFSALNPRSDDELWFLEISYPLLDSVDLYVPASKDTPPRVIKISDQKPFRERPLDHNNYVFPLSEPPGGPHVYYLRISTNSSLNMPIAAWSQGAFALRNAREQALLGGYFGLLIALAVYNLAIFYSMRDKTYATFSTAVIAFGLLAASLTGLGAQYLWPNWPWWGDRAPASLTTLAVITHLVFTSTLLETKRRHRGFARVYDFFVVLNLFTLAYTFLGGYGTAVRFSTSFAAICSLVPMLDALHAARQGFRPARTFLVACSAYYSGVFVYAVSRFGLLPINPLTTWAMFVGSALQFVFLSVAVADRINWMRRSRDEELVQTTRRLAEAADGLKTANQMLEERVRQRTEQLTGAKTAAEEANEGKSTFLATMSHEIRTPLNGILGMLEIVLDTELTEAQRDNFDAIKTSAHALLSVLNDILDLGKVEAGKLELNLAALGICSVVHETMRVCAVRAHGKGIELVVACSPAVPHALIGDANRLRQIVLNLVNNAIKFTDQGEIVVSVDIDSETEQDIVLRIRVRDTGIGIPPDKQASIFQAFSQAEKGTARKYGGTGLGLTIASELVRLMNGTLGVESKPGVGSTFSFTTRLQKQSSSVLDPVAAYLPMLKDMPVLVVDDNRSNLSALETTLRSWGMQCICADSPSDAWTCIEDARSDGMFLPLAFIDAFMPCDDGFSLVRRIHDENAPVGYMILMLTVDNWLADVGMCRSLNIRSYLRKPVAPQDMLDAILVGLDVSPAPVETKASIPALQQPLRGLHVLLAEDNAINQHVAVHFLTKDGHCVQVANDGKEALEALRKERFDLILMDCQMPHLNGYEATRKIREQEEASGTHIPIIAMTANAMKGDREHCLQVGMDGYVPKPIAHPVLQNEIRRVLRMHNPMKVAISRRPAPLIESPSTKAPSIKVPSIEAPSTLPTMGNIDFDENALLEMMGGSRELLLTTMQMFVDDAASHLSEIRVALAEGDAERFCRAAHTLKGLSLNFRAQALADTALALETLGKSGSTNPPADLMQTLQSQLDSFTNACRVYLASQTSGATNVSS